MEKIVPNWTKNELKAYSFIYIMNANIEELADEIEFIKFKVGKDTYQKMHSEFEKDNDYQSIQKIKSSHNLLGYSKKEDTAFFKEMKELFTKHSEDHPIEKGLYTGLKKVLK